MDDRQRREFHEALLDADSFEELPGKWQQPSSRRSATAEAAARVERLGPIAGRSVPGALGERDR
jgi:hypothetical protein